MLGATVWLVQQCEAGTRVSLLDKPAVAPGITANSFSICRRFRRIVVRLK